MSALIVVPWMTRPSSMAFSFVVSFLTDSWIISASDCSVFYGHQFASWVYLACYSKGGLNSRNWSALPSCLLEGLPPAIPFLAEPGVSNFFLSGCYPREGLLFMKMELAFCHSLMRLVMFDKPREHPKSSTPPSGWPFILTSGGELLNTLGWGFKHSRVTLLSSLNSVSSGLSPI